MMEKRSSTLWTWCSDVHSA